MDKWKAEVGRVREEKKKGDQRRERVRKTKMQGHEKVEKSQINMFSQWFQRAGIERRVQSHLARWEMENCMMLWREARFEKILKTDGLGPPLEVEMSEQCVPIWREAHFEVKMYKTPQCRITFGSWDVEKVHATVARSTFWSQNAKGTKCPDHFWTLQRRFVWHSQWSLHPPKSEKNVRVL